MIIFNDKRDAYFKLKQYLNESKFSKVFILCDNNTKENCLPLFIVKIGKSGLKQSIIEIKNGEKNKNLKTCELIWTNLLEQNCDRHSLMINLGGGVITDIGGFAASTFKRGIKYINIPTTLLAMADASSGGKTGIDYLGYKNMIGVFSQPQFTIIDTDYLKTLEEIHLKSGFAEMLKHGLIRNVKHWNELISAGYKNMTYKLIKDSVNIKSEIVESDPFESGQRKLLNFGHTVGHAIESLSLKNDDNHLTHGEAVAIGMIVESYISYSLGMIDEEALQQISKNIFKCYSLYEIPKYGLEEILEYLKNDKKSIKDTYLFVLLKNIGEAVYNNRVEEEIIIKALGYYSTTKKYV